VLKGLFIFAGGAVVGAGATFYFGRRIAKAACAAHLLGEGTGALPIPATAIATHLRQIRRYGFASSQDKSPIVGLTHASYALVLLDTLEEIVGRDAAEKSGVNTRKLRTFITKLQDRHAEALSKCDAHLQAILQIERENGLPRLPGFVVAGAPLGA
jgi:hypothetical protein